MEQGRGALRLIAFGSLIVTSVAAMAVAGTDGPLVGRVSRQQVEAAVPDWVGAEVESHPDVEAAEALEQVAPGARVEVFFGTWCSDSRRALARLWQAYDESAGPSGREWPFELDYIAVDRNKREPADLVAGADLHYVPTFVVFRGGREVGRIVEGAPHGIEHDLLDLLEGREQGLITTRDDLREQGGVDPDAGR